MSNPPRLPDTFNRLAWSNLAAQSAEQIALTEVGWLPLYYGKANLLFSSKVHGLVVTPQGIFPEVDWTKVTVDK